MQIDKEIDARGYNCPIPLMKTKKTMAEMQAGQVLRVLASDSGSLKDILAFSKQGGHEMLEQRTEGADYIHVLRHG